MAKKRRSAKQKANDRRLGLMAKRRSKTTKRRASTKKGGVRKTARRAYKKVKKTTRRMPLRS